MTTLVEGLDPDQMALAAYLARERRAVTIVGSGELDAVPGDHDEAFLDVWTAEVAPRVARLRARGCRLRSLADLVLERATVPTVGVTGTAGKTTTSAFLVELLREAGVTTHASTTARAGNLWPTTELLLAPQEGVIVAELTSSHLCFTHRSPNVAVITSFWADHLELHGSLARYRAAKEAIVRWQQPGDVVVVNEDDASAVGIATLPPGRRLGFSATGEVAAGAFRRGDELVLRDGDETSLPLPAGLDRPRLQALLRAAAAALALGVRPTRVAAPVRPRFRSSLVGRAGSTELVDDGMAATPAKTTAGLRDRQDASVVLVAGGELASGGLAVHDSPEESRLLEAACAEIRRATRLVVLFGPAAERIAPLLGSVSSMTTRSLAEAIDTAAARLEGAAALVVSPMFPLPLAERESIAPALAAFVRPT